MRQDDLLRLLEQVSAAEISPAAASEMLLRGGFEDLGFAKVDHDRTERCGRAEVIYGQGKTAPQVIAIFDRLAARGANVLATRLEAETARALLQAHPAAVHHERARAVTLLQETTGHGGRVGVVCAGTSDLPVADEAAVTAEVFGSCVTRVTDVGVAGLHRLLAHLDLLRTQDALVVCAGMEGALPSVLGGLVRVPVLAVPTSVGYGASFGGLAALLGMLNACAPNISVVNIDNGFGAGYLASMIAGGWRTPEPESPRDNDCEPSASDDDGVL